MSALSADAAGCAPDPADCRCLCGSLLARVVPGGVELKCRRCKRTMVVPLAPPKPRRAAHPTGALPAREAG